MQITKFTTGELSTNTYVLVEGTTAVVIDPAFDKSLQVAKSIANCRLEAIILTHGHFDHCGGVKQLLDRFGSDVSVYCHKDDWDLAHVAQSNVICVECDNCFPNEVLTEGDLNIGPFRFRVIETPGHTAGSVSLLCGEDLFSGDTLFCGCIGRTDFAESRPKLMKSSLNKLALLGSANVHPGHGTATTLQHELYFNPFMN